MSLINEALKRTRDAAYQSSSAGPMSMNQYRIANNSNTTSLGSGLGIVLAAITLGACAGAIIFFLGHSLFPSQKKVQQLPPVSTVHGATVSPPSAPAPPPPRAQDSQAKNSATQVQAGKPPTAKAATPDEAAEDALVAKLLQKMKAEQSAAPKATEAPPRPVPAPPKLVLHGITSQGNSREAMINGYSVREGEEIEGARVVAIDARSVKLRFADQEFVLRMP